jgi:hypothetical protein
MIAPLALALGLVLAQGPAFTDAAEGGAMQGLQCTQYRALVSHLELQYGERRVGYGINFTGQILELFAHQDGRSWTILIIWPAGLACIFAEGRDWAAEPAPRNPS